MIEGEWHAFYSEEAKKNMRIMNKYTKKEPESTNMYRLKGTDELVEVTCVVSVEDCPNPELYYNWKDRKYLGIVDAWIRTVE